MGWAVASFLMLILNLQADNMFWVGVWSVLSVVAFAIMIRDQF